jgi:hypothetical protein
VKVRVLAVELTFAEVGLTVMVPVPSAEVPTATLGELARSVKVPLEVDFSEVVNVELPNELGAVAPGPELAFEP